MTVLIGSRRHAIQAHKVHSTLYDGFGVSEGWSVVGSGCFRDVYLHEPTGVVYKVDTENDNDYSNRAEWRNARRLRKFAWEHVYIPKTSLFRVDGQEIIAMEYVDGLLGKAVAGSYQSAGYKELFSKVYMEDMHGANYKINSAGKFVPVDMASELTIF